ncbi:TAXI family TRAP transporter solute-binding subunit [Sneathiella chungangensis]|uniref:TAXI family TRAP transporter solute-binding subunit n=1 Tax=Sneathiella chungangensis TaxID=1418234 RepID=A0A845MIX2_9PROT|nr:TAXI family TRAP transporter solute-binding subunit [Sneathiella chungangensis]MZR23888.1 TAXI family TRAP transporter solute-binding subunit [Sneathiella chungangensis]
MKSLISAIALTVIAFQPGVAMSNEFVTFGASDSGGTYGVIAAAVSKVANVSDGDLNVSVEATVGGGRGNVRLLSKERLTFGLATVADAVNGYRGTGAFEDSKAENLRTVMLGPDLPFHLMVRADSDISSPADLKGKRLVSASAGNALTFVPGGLSGYGLDKDSYTITQLSGAEAVETFRDGRVDAYANFNFMPSANLSDLATSIDIRILGFDPEKLAELIKSVEMFNESTIPAGTYPGQTDDINVPGIAVGIFTTDSVSDDVVYALTKAVMESNAEMKEMHSMAGTLTKERQGRMLKAGRIIPPLHPGALRYYKEIGLN